MNRVSGLLYTPDGFREGTVGLAEGRVQEVAPRREREVLARGLVLPLFWNAHTHLGDSVVLEEPHGSLEEVVAPPGGLKFRRLEAASEEEQVEAMARSLGRMLRGGAGGFLDFREGGVPGVRLLRKALEGSPVRGLVLGRPRDLRYEREEVEGLLAAADGVAVSSLSDWPPGDLAKLARHVRSARKPFALHASEARREEIDAVLDLRPSFLVHLTAATPDDWARTAQEGVPVAVTPRSQLLFGRVPDLPGMHAAGLRLMLGTDNAMLAPPSLKTELEVAYQVARLRGGLPPRSILAMAYEAANLLTEPSPTHILEGDPCALLVLDLPLGGDPDYQAIRASEGDIALLAVGPRIWQRRKGWHTED